MAILTDESRAKIEAYFIEAGLFTDDQLEHFRRKAQAENEPLFAYLMREEIINDEQLAEAERQLQAWADTVTASTRTPG